MKLTTCTTQVKGLIRSLTPELLAEKNNEKLSEYINDFLGGC